MAVSADRATPARARSAVSLGAVSLAGAITVAVVLRFATLGIQSFDSDELFTVWLVRMPFGEMLHTIPHSESTPPLYYILAWPWSHVFGDGEVPLRALSAVFGGAAVAAGYGAARRFISRRAAHVAAWLLAVNPLLVWYSQEARAYALLILLAAISLGAAADVVERTTTRRLVTWVVVATLALYTHYFAAFLMLAEAAWIVFRSRRRSTVVAAVIPFVAALALIPMVLTQHRAGNQEHVNDSPLLRRVLSIPKNFLTGFSIPHEIFVTLAALALAACALVLLLRRSPDRAGGLTLLGLGLPSIVLPVLLAFAGWDVVAAKYVIAAVVPLAIAFAAGFAASRLGIAAAAALCVLSLFAIVSVAADRQYQREDWERGGRALGPALTTRVVLVTPETRPGLWAYTEPVTLLPSRGARVREIDVVGLDVVGYESTGAPQAPHPSPPPRGPVGFKLVRREYRPTYTLLRYRAARPVLVTRRDLAPLHLVAALPDTAFVQRPGATRPNR